MRGTTIQLPSQLAPALAERVERLLAEVPLVTRVDLAFPTSRSENVCVVCHRGGKLGGHHGTDSAIEWIHRSCHRKLHRRGAPTRKSAHLAHELSLLAG